MQVALQDIGQLTYLRRRVGSWGSEVRLRAYQAGSARAGPKGGPGDGPGGPGWRIVSGTAVDWCLKPGKPRKSFEQSFTGLICRYASDQG
jgi:hypothetical protein